MTVKIYEAVVDRSNWNEGFTTVHYQFRINTFAIEEHHNGINERISGFHIGSTFRAR